MVDIIDISIKKVQPSSKALVRKDFFKFDNKSLLYIICFYTVFIHL